jgi:hypothetical protein
MELMPSRLLVVAALAAGLVARGAGQAQAPAKLDLSPKALVKAATKYVGEYRTKLKYLNGQETYFQETFDSADHRTGSRLMKGEMYFVYLEQDHDWIAVHDIKEVEGAPVPDRDDVQALFLQGAGASVAGKVAARNAKYNIGTIGRNFNEPTLALAVLDASRVSNFSFNRKQVDVAGATTLVTLTFSEKDRPTLVHSLSGSPLFSKGELVIEADTGRVRSTRISIKDGDITADLVTTYVLEPKMEMWVPSLFTERYSGEPFGLKQIVTCTARYTDYKRWGVDVRIK